MPITDIHIGMSVELQYSIARSSIPVDPPAIKAPVDQPTDSPFPRFLPSTRSHRVCILSSLALAQMQDPKKEIVNIVRTLCTTKNAVELEETVTKYFVPDAKFSHPMCRANSRNEILGLFQWYRLASPETHIHVSSVMYDADLSVLILDVKEKLKVWFIPLPSKDGRMIVRLQLRKINGYHYIMVEEDLSHPMDQVGFLASPLLPLVAIYLRLGCLLSNLGACVFRSVGLNSGLRGGTVSYAGLMEAAGLARTSGDKSNGHAKE